MSVAPPGNPYMTYDQYSSTPSLQQQLDQAIQRQDCTRCQTLFLQMKQEGTLPSGESFEQYLSLHPLETVLDHYIHTIRKVIQVGDEFISALVKSGNIFKLSRFVEKMFDAGIFLKADTSASVLSILLSQGEIKTATSLYEKMTTAGWYPNPLPTDLLERAISSCLKEGKTGDALRVFQNFSGNIAPEITTTLFKQVKAKLGGTQ